MKHNDGGKKIYEINAASLPRFFYIQYQSDFNQIQILLDTNQEKILSETHQLVQADRSRMLFWFQDGTQLVWNGTFRVIYANDKIELLFFEMRDHQTYIPLSKLPELCPLVSPDQNKSPRMTKGTGKQRNQLRGQQTENTFKVRELPKPVTVDGGVTVRMQQFFEVSYITRSAVGLILNA